MEKNNKVLVSELKEALELVQLTGDEESLKRYIMVPDINRPGLELAGVKEGTELKRVVIIGNKEANYVKTLDEKTQEERFSFLMDDTPCIIYSSHHEISPVLLETAKKKNFPVLKYSGDTYQIVVDVVSFLSEKMAPCDSVHGVMMSIYGTGVMIKGSSGIGKSELALDLIKRGHMFVADDRVDISRVHNAIYSKAPEILKDLLEIRGLGIIDVGLLFGGEVILDKAQLDLIIELKKFDEVEFSRVAIDDRYENMLGVEIPLVQIPVTEGRPISSIVETCVANYILKQKGINTTDILENRVLKEISKNKEER